MSDIVLWPDVLPTPNSLVNNPFLLRFGVDIGEMRIRSRLKPHWHDYTQLWYVMDGEIMHTVNGVTYRQTPGSLVTVLPYLAHSYECSDEGGMPKVISIGFDDSFFTGAGVPLFSYDSRRACFENFSIPVFTRFSPADRENADALANSMMSELHKHQDISVDAVRGMLYDFLLLAYSNSERVQVSQNIRERGELVTVASRYISKNCRESLLINDVCPMTMMSRRLFTDSFKDITDLTFSTYAQTARLDVAANRISVTEDTLSDIAEMSGFSSKSHLSRSFSEYFGMTPLTYRELARHAAWESHKNALLRYAWLHETSNA